MKDKKFGVLNRIKSYSTIVNQSNHSYKSQKTTTNQPTSGDSVENKGTLKEIVLVLRRRWGVKDTVPRPSTKSHWKSLCS